jgi:hypothetical protein
MQSRFVCTWQEIISSHSGTRLSLSAIKHPAVNQSTNNILTGELISNLAYDIMEGLGKFFTVDFAVVFREFNIGIVSQGMTFQQNEALTFIH